MYNLVKIIKGDSFNESEEMVVGTINDYTNAVNICKSYNNQAHKEPYPTEYCIRLACSIV